MKIGYDNIQSIKYKVQTKRKRHLLNSAIDFCSQFIVVDDVATFQKDFRKYAMDKIEKRTGLKNISIEKFAELTDLPYKELKRHQIDYESINVDLDAPEPDFTIYATDDAEIKLFKELTELCDQLNKHNPKNWIIIQNSFDLKVQRVNGKWMPNSSYIKNKKHKSI